MRGGPLVLVLFMFACGPGPTTTEPATPPAPSSSITPTTTPKAKPGPDCAMKAMEKLASTITDAGMRSDLDASNAQEEAEPADATPVLQKLAPKLSACNPQELEGCAYLTTNVEPDGSVGGVETFVSDGLPREVLDCIRGVVREARFAAPPKAGKMTVPVTFTRTR